MACGIFPDQGSNPCPLHWHADSQPLRHQGSPQSLNLKVQTILSPEQVFISFSSPSPQPLPSIRSSSALTCSLQQLPAGSLPAFSYSKSNYQDHFSKTTSISSLKPFKVSCQLLHAICTLKSPGQLLKKCQCPASIPQRF